MSVKTDSQLTTQANIIKNETIAAANTATRVGQMVVDLIDSKPNVSLIPLEYEAVFSQSGTSDPTVSIANNTLSGAIAWTRSGTGTYIGTLAGVFTVQKTFFNPIHQQIPASDRSIKISRNDSDTIQVDVTKISDNSAVDLNIGSGFSVEIKIYP